MGELSSIQFDYFQIFYLPFVEHKTHERLYSLLPVLACGSRIEAKHLPRFVELYMQNMAMAVNEELGGLVVYYTIHFPGETPAMDTDVSEDDMKTFQVELLYVTQHPAQVASVGVPSDCTNGFVCAQQFEHFGATDVSGMPDLIDIAEVLQDALVQKSVRIGE